MNTAKFVAERVQKHRKALRALRTVSNPFWAPDTRKRGFKAEFRRQAAFLSNDKQKAGVLHWLETLWQIGKAGSEKRRFSYGRTMRGLWQTKPNFHRTI